ncbi:LysR family transcriptional regulator [Roseateles sp. DAIF2]|uniref:LysR family transcriptional regulator n=1 Tax=Roseateles sp. DAIF2 TaxID=2714952 RepID=UPI0018A32F58|nr:LysR family transcriptional regulator [Roseateles sp. DAIF2]QPF72851.1 LysR family transcriptional regulator [Roseateles sp. DAIF2]
MTVSIPSGLDWDDLRILLQIARHGRLAAAAEAGPLSHATLFRRLRALEARLGMRLFERLRAGYEPTRAGAELIEFARRMDGELQAVTAGLRGRESWPGGLVRLSAADTWMQGLLPPLLASYQTRHQVQLGFRSGNAMDDVLQGAVDVALRSGGKPPEPLVGRRLARVEATVYCSRKLGGVRADRLADQPWVGVDEQLSHLASARWLEREGLASRVAMRSNSLVHVLQLVRAGVGLGALPCYLGDADPGLRRVFDPPRDWRSELWLLTRVELRPVPRIKALFDHLYEGTRDWVPLLEGMRPQP